MPPKALTELAILAAIKNIDLVESVGDFLPYEKVKKIIMRIDNAQQLHKLEGNCRQLVGNTGEHWKRLIERNFPLEYRANPREPARPGDWYKVYDYYKQEHANNLEKSERQLKDAMAGLRHNKEMNTSKIVGGNEVPAALKIGAKRWAHGSYGSSSSRPAAKFMTTGESVMRKVRREAKNIKASMRNPVPKPPAAPAIRPPMRRNLGKAPVPESITSSSSSSRPTAVQTPARIPILSGFRARFGHGIHPAPAPAPASAPAPAPASNPEAQIIKPQARSSRPQGQTSKPAPQSPRPSTPQAQVAKASSASPVEKPQLSPFQQRFGPKPYIKKDTAAPATASDPSRTPKRKADDSDDGSTTDSGSIGGPPRKIRRTPEAHPPAELHPSPRTVDELIDQVRRRALEIELAPPPQPPRKRRPANVLLPPKRR